MLACACGSVYDEGPARTCPSCGRAPAVIDGFAAWAPELARGGGGFEAGYFEGLSELEDASFWFRQRNRLIVDVLRAYFPGLESFLEVGCGTAYVLRGVATAFPSARLVGSEVFVDGLRVAQARVPSAELVQLDVRAMPYRDAFDVAGAFDVLEHVDDDAAALAGLRDAVRPGGGIVIAVPQHPWLWSAADEYARHERRYTAAGLHTKVHAAGLEIVRSTSFVVLPLPLMVASRFAQRHRRDYDPTAELRIPRPVNAALERLLAAERAAIRRGVNAPVGGSRLVVARRR